MTYCVGMMIDRGMLFMSDTRTNSGVDNISTFRKMFTWSVPGERLICLCTAGNLATTQSVISQIEERAKAPADRHPSILEAPSMFQVATSIGRMLRDTIENDALSGETAKDNIFSATMLLGGQIAGGEPRLFMIYPEGNFIEASADTPFFQIGETKYGRPILVRGYDHAMSFEDAAKLLMVSFDSTLKANLSVGLPLDLMIQQTDRFTPLHHQRIERDDPYFRTISEGWGDALKQAFQSLPPFTFAGHPWTSGQEGFGN